MPSVWQDLFRIGFCKKKYKHIIYINFFENPSYASIFDNSLNVDDITMYITGLLGDKAIFKKDETCLIMDELQECPNARTSLKFFKTDGRYDVIFTWLIIRI